jgi:hypothetical protein
MSAFGRFLNSTLWRSTPITWWLGVEHNSHTQCQRPPSLLAHTVRACCVMGHARWQASKHLPAHLAGHARLSAAVAAAAVWWLAAAAAWWLAAAAAARLLLVLLLLLLLALQDDDGLLERHLTPLQQVVPNLQLHHVLVLCWWFGMSTAASSQGRAGQGRWRLRSVWPLQQQDSSERATCSNSSSTHRL